MVLPTMRLNGSGVFGCVSSVFDALMWMTRMKTMMLGEQFSHPSFHLHAGKIENCMEITGKLSEFKRIFTVNAILIKSTHD